MGLTAEVIFLLAFATGLLHALDADHVMAVTVIASKKMGMKAVIALCLKWSLGHGAILFIAGSLIFYFGMSIPHELSHYAEKMVALVLLLIGVWILKDLYQSRARVEFHKHHGLEQHAHWQVDHPKLKHKHEHKAVMIGMLHGLAGLAPLLVIIPVTTQPLWLSILYLFIFCVGVFLSMLVFGGALGKIFESVQRNGQKSVNILRGMLGVASISLGLVWMF